MTDLNTARKQLINIRNDAGASSPIGSRCSLAIEQLQNADKPEFADIKPKLHAGAMATLAELSAIKAGGRADTQIRPRDLQ